MLSKTRESISPFLTVGCVAVLLAACATQADAVTRKKPKADESKSGSSVGVEQNSGEPIVLELNFNPDDEQRRVILEVNMEIEKGPLGLTLRRVSEASNAGIVLMGGLEDFRYGPYTFEDASVAEVLNAVSEDSNYLIAMESDYAFIHPPGYEVLNQWKLKGRLPGFGDSGTVDIAVGASTPLFAALSLISHSFDITLVADNAIAESKSGELHLYGASLETILEALLRSARVPPTSVEFEKGSGYVLLRSLPLRPAPAPMINVQSIPATAQAWLNKPAHLTLPESIEDNQNLMGHRGATTLKELLPVLSEQLGIRVTANKDAQRLPVNPMAARNVTVRQALDLMVQQWLVPVFGYEVTEDGVIFRRR